MNTFAMPPSYLKNSDRVVVESLLPGTTAHRPGCRAIRRTTLSITVVEALAHLHAQWCHRCMGRQQ